MRIPADLPFCSNTVTTVTDALDGLGYSSGTLTRSGIMLDHFTPETAIFETVDVNHPAVPRHCGVCNQNPPAFAYRYGEFTDGNRTGHCCTPCASRHLIEMAERSASSGNVTNRNAS